MYPFKECTHCDAARRRDWDDTQCVYCKGTGLMLRSEEENELSRLLSKYGILSVRIHEREQHKVDASDERLELAELEEYFVKRYLP